MAPGSRLGDPEWLAVADRTPGAAHGRVRPAAAADEELAIAAAPALEIVACGQAGHHAPDD